jgi:hypothetical protein
MTIFYNPTGSDVELDDFGVTVPANGIVDANYISAAFLKRSDELAGYISNGVIQILADDDAVSDLPNAVVWSTSEALNLISLGVNSTQVGLQKANHPGIVVGQYYSSLQSQASLVANTISGNSLYATPVAFMAQNFNRLGIEVTMAVANGQIRLGIYDNDAGQPGNLLLDAGYIATDTVGKKEITISFQSPLDWYWLAALPSVDVVCQTITAGGFPSSLTGTIDTSTSEDFANSVTYGSLPSTFPTLNPSWENPPVIWLRQV